MEGRRKRRAKPRSRKPRESSTRAAGIEILYTNVFWGGRSEIKPSEISPLAYAHWCRKNGIEPATMRA